MASNTASLLSVLLRSGRVVDERTLLNGLRLAFQEQLPVFGFKVPLRQIQTHAQLVGYQPGLNRSVRGSINDFVAQVRAHLECGALDLPNIMSRVNESPMSMLGMESPLSSFPRQ